MSPFSLRFFFFFTYALLSAGCNFFIFFLSFFESLRCLDVWIGGGRVGSSLFRRWCWCFRMLATLTCQNIGSFAKYGGANCAIPLLQQFWRTPNAIIAAHRRIITHGDKIYDSWDIVMIIAALESR